MELAGPTTSRIELASDEEYEYLIYPAALETLVNALLRYGIDLRSNYYDSLRDIIVFNSNRLLDIRSLKERKVVRSYTITKIKHVRQIVERG